MRTTAFRTIACMLVVSAFVLLALNGINWCVKAPCATHAPCTAALPFATRSNFTESEPNDGSSSADALSRSNSPINLTGNVSQNDQDWYSINLNGGSGPVDNLSFTPRSILLGGNTALTIWVYGSYPGTSDNYILLSQYYWGDTKNPCWIHASYTGTYLIWIQKVYASTASTVHYNFWVNVTSVTPNDTYNDIGSALEFNKTQAGNVSLNENCYDFYKFKLPDSNWPSRLNFTVNITKSPVNVYWGGSFKVIVIVPVFFMYKLKSSPGTYTTERYQLSRDTTETSLQPTKTFNFEKNVTEAIIGFTVDTYGYSSGTPTQRYILDAPQSQGWANYTIDIAGIKSMTPNKAPILSGGSVTPATGRTTNTYTYSVKYQDEEGWEPRGIKVTVDSTAYPMAKRSGEGSDYVSGVVYEATVPGTALGEGSHTYSFFCTDQKDPALGDTGLHTGPYLDDNYAPKVRSSPLAKVTIAEDSPLTYVALSSIFEDPDSQPLDYTLLNSGTWSKVLSHSLAQLTILANGTMKVAPNANKHGAFNVSLNATDGKAWCAAPYVLQIEITPVNDKPVISKIGGKSVSSGQVNLVVYEDQWTNVVIDASDSADGENVTVSTDIASALASAAEGVNWRMDQKNKTLSFLPSDADVGYITLNVSASDGNGGDVWAKAVVEVKNSNDAPLLAPILNLSVGQYFTKNLTLTAADDDLDSGDTLLFFTDIQQAIPGLSPGTDFLWSPDTGNLSLSPYSQSLIGEYSVTFGVQDREGKNDTQVIKITIVNTNDPPLPKAITIKGGVLNLTVIASTEAAYDLDGDALTYTWDFGDAGQAGSGEGLLSLSHNYSAPGRYNITLTVSDGQAASAKKLEVQVTAPLPPVIPDDDDDDDDIEPNITDDDDTKPNVTENQTEPEGGIPCAVWVLVIVIIVLMIALVAILLVASKKKKKAKKAKRQAAPAPKEEAVAPSGPVIEEAALLEPAPTYEPAPEGGVMYGGQAPVGISGEAEPAPLPAGDDTLALPPAQAGAQAQPKEQVLDEIFGGMEDKAAKAQEPATAAEPAQAAPQPAAKEAPKPSKGVPSATEIDDIFANIDEGPKK